MRRWGRIPLWIALGCASAFAQQKKPPPPKPYAEAREEYEEAAKQPDTGRLVRALSELARAGLISEDKTERSYVRNALRRGLKHRSAEVKVAAAKGFGVLRMAGTSRDLKKALRQAGRPRQPKELALALIEAWGAIHDDDSHGELIALIEKPTADKTKIELARAAAEALRGYRGLPKPRRAEIVGDLMQVFDKLFSGSHRRVDEDAPEIRYWKAVEPRMVAAFNSLTRQRLESYYECARWWQENRRDMKGGDQ